MTSKTIATFHQQMRSRNAPSHSCPGTCWPPFSWPLQYHSLLAHCCWPPLCHHLHPASSMFSMPTSSPGRVLHSGLHRRSSAPAHIDCRISVTLNSRNRGTKNELLVHHVEFFFSILLLVTRDQACIARPRQTHRLLHDVDCPTCQTVTYCDHIDTSALSDLYCHKLNSNYTTHTKHCCVSCFVLPSSAHANPS